MAAIPLSLPRARRIAVRAQALDGSARDVLDAIRRMGRDQLDPTNTIAPSHLLTIWSRLGTFSRAELERLLWRERALFEWKAFIYPTEDFPIAKAGMASFPGNAGAWQRRVGAWLRTNDAFRRYVLRELRRRGPLLSRELEDRSVRPWPSPGWTAGRNVTQMLNFLFSRGEVLVAGRRGGQRMWDLPERVLPRAVLRVRPATPRRIADRQLGCAGIARASRAYEGIGVAVRVEGVDGRWIAHPEGLRQADDPVPRRMTLLSPFDPLIYDRERAEALFGFRYRTAIYVRAAERTQGSYALPILYGERLVGRLDAVYDREAGRLRVDAVYREPGAPIPETALRSTLRDLGKFLGARNVDQP